MAATVSVVTGANRGIGAAMADRLARRGPVVGTYRTSPPAQPDCRWAQLDVTEPASQAAFAQALDGAPVALLVCNAGVYLDKHEALPGGFAADLWAQTFAANVTGVFLTVQALLPNLKAAQGARIAIISSQMGSSTRAPGGSYIYRASKAAALNLGRNLAADLAPSGISVGIYHPGWVQTDMGGAAAEITVDQAADGLVERFAALGPDTTGVFETWDGRPHAY